MELLFRRRLVSQIESSPAPVTYIYGPSGFGKSSLARQFVQSSNLPHVWFEGRATTTARELFIELSESIANVLPEFKSEFQKFQARESFTAKDVGDFLGIFHRIKREFILVIDDAEQVSDLHNDISLAFIKDFPNHLKFIVVRSPAPTLSNLKEFGFHRFQVISPEELRFNREEFKLLAASMTKNITKSDLDQLFDFTEGWPQGSALALEIYANLLPDQIPNFFDQLRRDGKARFTNLAHKVLALCSKAETETLLCCALAIEIDPDLAVSLSGDLNSIKHLTRLANEGIVI